jgi:NAD(P)-dependent dehydrogenase (short-subunit alcohol dehydrogenase family)
VLTLMTTVAREEQRRGVRANAVVPTSVRTSANMQAMGDDGPYVERESVADVVAFLASALARNVNGQAIRLA